MEVSGFRFQARLWGFMVPLPRAGEGGEAGHAHLQGVPKAQPWPPGGLLDKLPGISASSSIKMRLPLPTLYLFQDELK